MTKAPSIKTLTEAVFDRRAGGEPVRLTVEQAKELRAMMKSMEDTKAAVEPVMERARELIGGFDLQVLWGGWTYWPRLEYVNMGDPYDTTIIYDRAHDEFFVGNWGTEVELHPRTYGE